MKKYYYDFYSNTWIYDEDKIIESYFEIYENLKTKILVKINYICESWILWRKILDSFDEKENCFFIFIEWSYKIIFNAIKDDKNKKNKCLQCENLNLRFFLKKINYVYKVQKFKF